MVADRPGSEDRGSHDDHGRHLGRTTSHAHRRRDKNGHGHQNHRVQKILGADEHQNTGECPDHSPPKHRGASSRPGCGHQQPDRQRDGNCLRHHRSVTGDQCRRYCRQAGGDQTDARSPGDPSSEHPGQQDGDTATECAGQLEACARGDTQFQETGEEQRIAGHEIGSRSRDAVGEEHTRIRVPVATGHDGTEQHVADRIEAQFQVLPDREGVGDPGDQGDDHLDGEEGRERDPVG